MAPYVAAVIPSRYEDVKVKLYLPIDTMKYLDDASQSWVWDNQSHELIDVITSQSMHDFIPSLPPAKKCGTNAWDLRLC